LRLGETELARVDARARLAPGTWYYDPTGESLQVMVRAAARGHEIVNVTF
jgi:hypothetical protein